MSSGVIGLDVSPDRVLFLPSEMNLRERHSGKLCAHLLTQRKWGMFEKHATMLQPMQIILRHRLDTTHANNQHFNCVTDDLRDHEWGTAELWHKQTWRGDVLC